MNSRLRCGILLAAMGALFVGLGLYVAFTWTNVQYEGNMPPWMFCGMFVLLGGIEFIAGVMLIRNSVLERKYKEHVQYIGQKTFAEITDFEDDYSIEINGRPGYNLIARTMDGKYYRSAWVNPEYVAPDIGTSVTLYADPNTPESAVMVIGADSILAQEVEKVRE